MWKEVFLALQAGRGCSHCPWGAPVIRTSSRAGSTSLCIDCAREWFPTNTAAWLEERMKDFKDHEGDRLRAIVRKQFEESARLAAGTAEGC